MANYHTMKLLLLLSMLSVHIVNSATTSCPSSCACSITTDGQKQVHCANTNLHNVPSSIDRDVAYLDLRGNRIKHISKDIFAGYTNLRVLQLDGNIISAIEPLAFQDLKDVELLSLTNNRLSRVSEKAFAYIQGRSDCYNGTRTCVLDLRMNDIEVIESSAFAWITRLNVKLGTTKVTTTLKPYSFYGAKRIASIQIHNISKLQLEQHWLSETDGIGILHIRFCMIQKVMPFLFEGISDLCMMVFENNSFSTILPYGFSGIKFADFSCVDRLKQQTEVSSEYGSPDDKYIPKLSVKDGEEAGLVKPQVNQGCGGLVIFEHSSLPVLSTDMFRDTNLVQIELTGCHIKTMEPNVFKGLDCLRNLYVSDNIIETGLSPGSFGALNNLKDVIFCSNELITIHDHAFQGSQQVQRLVFRLKPNKNFSLSSQALSGLTDIGHIEIAGSQSDANFLILHRGAFDELVGVINITISNVHIPTLSEYAFHGIGKVKTLSFVDVQIDHFSSKAFGSVPVRTPISSFLITGDNTGIKCDCDTLREVFNLNHMFEDYTIMCNSDIPSEGFISQRQTLSTDLMQYKNCKYDDRADSSVNSANRNPSSIIVIYNLIVVVLVYTGLCK